MASFTKRVPTSNADLATLYHRRGLVYEMMGQFDLALSDLETALDLSQEIMEPQLTWHVLIQLGKLWSSRDYDRAHDCIACALELARGLDDPVILARSLNRMGNWHANNEEPGQALAYHQEALRIFRVLGDRRNLAKTLDLMGIAQILSGNCPAGAASYDQAIDLFREFADYPSLVSSLIPRALAATGPLLLSSTPLYPPRDSFADVAEARKVARQIGSIPDEAWSCWALSLLHTMRGKLAAAKVKNRALENDVAALETEIALLQSDAFTPEAEKQQRLEQLQRRKELLEREVDAAIAL